MFLLLVIKRSEKTLTYDESYPSVPDHLLSFSLHSCLIGHDKYHKPILRTSGEKYPLTSTNSTSTLRGFSVTER